RFALNLLLRSPRPAASYTLSLHDALPISRAPMNLYELTRGLSLRRRPAAVRTPSSAASHRSAPTRIPSAGVADPVAFGPVPHTRSEEHTSELQSRENLVCRLLLEKKNTTP